MKKLFEVEDISYVVSYINNHFELCIDVANSKNKMLYDKKSFGYEFGDDPPDFIYKQFDSPSPFKVFSNVFSFIHNIIRKENPYFFRYNANEPQKMNLYRRVGERLAKKYGYIMFENKNEFMFYKV